MKKIEKVPKELEELEKDLKVFEKDSKGDWKMQIRFQHFLLKNLNIT